MPKTVVSQIRERHIGLVGAAGRTFIWSGKRPPAREGRIGALRELGISSVESLRRDGINEPTLVQIQRRAKKIRRGEY